MENWKDIIDYDGLYQVSDSGNVRSINRTVAGKNKTTRNINGTHIAPFIWRGYHCVKLAKNGKWKHFKVHRLVLEAFSQQPQEGLDVNHIDGDKSNNRLENLEWATRKENLIHAVETRLNKQCIAIVAKKHGRLFFSKSIRGMFRKLEGIENISCKEKTFAENVRRALYANGTYYGYSFARQVIQ